MLLLQPLLLLLPLQINAPFGAGVVSASTGILWGNTMDDFAQPNK
jgi:gamma-glutamyltranspeptidase